MTFLSPGTDDDGAVLQQVFRAPMLTEGHVAVTNNVVVVSRKKGAHLPGKITKKIYLSTSMHGYGKELEIKCCVKKSLRAMSGRA